MTLWDDYDYKFGSALPMPVWRYCPNCYTLADSNSLLKRCPKCPCVANNHLRVLPLDPEAAQAALRIGGQTALIQMIVALIGGDEAVQAIDQSQTALGSHRSGCATHAGLPCDKECCEDW